MLSNFALEPIKILASGFPVRRDGLVTQVGKKKIHNATRRRRTQEARQYPKK
jgi:hypothetical protein